MLVDCRLMEKLTTLFIGQHLIHLKETESTNLFLKSMANDSLEGTAVFADFQTNGRGQKGTQWESRAGENILLSILLKPSFLSIDNQFEISKMVAVALVNSLKAYLPNHEVAIKWPNDIRIGKLKIAGVLIENSLEGNKIKNSILGIGLNVNQTEQLLESSTSLKAILHQPLTITDVLNNIFKNIEIQYIHLKTGNTTSLHNLYINALYGKDVLNRFYINQLDREVLAIIRDVNKHGKLLLECDEVLTEYDLKEIKLLD